MTASASTAALTKQATVPTTPERAFDLFTREMSSWWPLQRFSVGESASGRVEMQGWVSGDIVETLPDGTTSVWGTVNVWDPPTRVAFSWHPGHDPADQTTVEVTFEASAAGDETVVTLVHSSWSSRPDGARARDNYDRGWDVVLGRYVEAA